jgi:hypothetical protein
MIVYSHDNGHSFAQWQALDGYADNIGLSIVASAGRGYVFINADSGATGATRTSAKRSLDGGATWQITLPSVVNWSQTWAMASGLQVIRVLAHGNNAFSVSKQIAISTDGGDHWLPDVLLADTAHAAGGLAITQNHILHEGVRASGRSSSWSISISDRSGQAWTPFQELPGQPITPYEYWGCLAADTTSETAIALTVCGISAGWSPIDLYIHRTTDGGQTWEGPFAITENAPVASAAAPQVFCRGKLWGVAWQDYGSPDSANWGIHWRLSANHGRDWYPKQQVDGTFPGTICSYGQFVGDSVRLYWQCFRDSLPYDYRSVSGFLLADTVAPVLQNGVPLGDEIPPGNNVAFLGTAWDNDSLLDFDAVLKRAGQTDSIVVPLSERVSPIDYRGFWQVPNETALWHYYYRAEDMWENDTVFPDTGVFTFHTEGWSAGDAIRPYGPLSFSVQVYPNPSNGWPNIQLSPGWFVHGAVTVAVYNVLGQRVWEERLMSVGLRAMQSAPTAYVSGVNVVKVTNGQHAMLQKFVVLK